MLLPTAAACILPAWAALRRIGPLSIASDLAASLNSSCAASVPATVAALWVEAAARLAAGEFKHEFEALLERGVLAHARLPEAALRRVRPLQAAEHAARYSLLGLRAALRHEAAFRRERWGRPLLLVLAVGAGGGTVSGLGHCRRRAQ
jgi:hypothetical protein